MARKKKPPAEGPSNAYLMSFGDTMTTLLAFFIVLNSLAEEQTGANLHSGTGSFVRVMNSMGLSGKFQGDRSNRAVNLDGANPLYISPDDSKEAGRPAVGPDENPNELRVIDREADQLERFLERMDERYQLQPTDETSAEIVLDFFEPFASEGPLLSGPYRSAALEVASRAVDPEFRIEFTVWATTPSHSAIKRAAKRALRIQTEFIQMLQLNAASQQRISATARCWFDSKAKRPVMSLTVRKR